MDSKILCPKYHVPIGTMLNCHCTCAISRDITPVLRQLHWLPVRQRVDFKIVTLVHRSLSGHIPSYLMIAGSSPTPEPDDCAQLTLEHWPSVALRVLSATEHLLQRHHGCGTVCHLSCDNANCHMDNLGVHLRHFYLGSRVTGTV